MFGRSTIAIVGVDPESLPKFQETLQDKVALLEISQYAASIITKTRSEETVGINPFASPRLDEVEGEQSAEVGLYLLSSNEDREASPLSSESVEQAEGFFGSSEEAFALGNQKYGFWLVENGSKDLTHPASKKEQVSYSTFGRPFKFLGKEEKKTVDDTVQLGAVMNRKQFPVIVDFQHGNVYIEASGADDITAAREVLTLLGAKTTGMRWDFKTCNWVADFFKSVQENTHFKQEMQSRAEELSRLRADQIEKLEDKNMEKVVSNFFALSQVDGTELWAGLSTPAAIRLHATSDPIGTSGVSAAFEITQKYSDAAVVSASVAFQEVILVNSKKYGELQIRRDLFTIGISDNMNNQEVGAALLPGFDLPLFKRELKQALKAKGSLSVRDFWYMWQEGMHNGVLQFVSNIMDILELKDGTIYGLKGFDEAEADAAGGE